MRALFPENKMRDLPRRLPRQLKGHVGGCPSRLLPLQSAQILSQGCIEPSLIVNNKAKFELLRLLAAHQRILESHRAYLCRPVQHSVKSTVWHGEKKG